MPTLRLRDQIEQARRLITDHLSDPAVQRRQEQRFVTWNESAEEFLETAGLVLALAMYQARREAIGKPGPESGSEFWEKVTQLLAADAASENLFAGLPADLGPESQHQIQALRLISVGIAPTTGIRWLRLRQTARDVAGLQP
ncbi:hypothetical protein JIX56_21580 [Streptomyces sp. CA-210063]|uniref:hypothetical protein n=1 Tax=Streptomyces sp. CA-210063 TaxID=2801029 RepID=UPI00214AD385|nr:hypothetical protein [Streptomyces sp. CA-210063]UUU32289.1 hypothetical protein JIX56_21580 [Streptomyces sp. CA-210063]